MEEEKNIGVGSFNIIESLYQPIKDQEKLFGDRKYNFFKENNVDPAELIGITRDPNAAVVELNKDDPKNKEVNPLYAKDVYNFIADLPDQALYRLVLGGMNGARLGVNLLPAFSRLIGAEPGEDRFDDIYKFSQQADENIKNKITMFKDIYSSAFKAEKGRDPNKASDFVSYIAQDYPYFAPIYSTLDKIGLPKTISVPLSVGLSSGVAFDPKQQTADGQSESSFFFDSASIKSLKEFFGALPNTPEGEIFDRAYQAFETTGVAAAIGPIINTALFLKRNVPAFNKAIPGAAVATGSATAIGEITDQTILNPQDETMQNQEPTILDNVRSGIDQFGNKLTQIGGAIKKEFSGEAMANPLVKKGVTELAPVFKSTVVEAIEKIPNKASGDQILGTLKNIPGVTQQEMKWIGIDDFLKGKPSVTKQEVSDFIEANRLDVNEVMLPRTITVENQKISNLSRDEQITNYINGNYEYDFPIRNSFEEIDNVLRFNDERIDTFRMTAEVIDQTGKNKFERNFIMSDFMDNFSLYNKFYNDDNSTMSLFEFTKKYKNPYLVFSLSRRSEEGLFTISNSETTQVLRKFHENFTDHEISENGLNYFTNTNFKDFKKFLQEEYKGQLRIGGFTKYDIPEDQLQKAHREYVVRSHNDFLSSEGEDYYGIIEAATGKTKDTFQGTKFKTQTIPGGEDYKELIFTLSKGNQKVGGKYPLEIGPTKQAKADAFQIQTSPHMAIPGEFAHVRFKTRNIEGQKVLTVEEMQSDLFQKSKIYNKKIVQDAKRIVGSEINMKQNQSGVFENITEEDVLQKAKPYIDDNIIKDFPFKNNWYELTTRRLVRYAADNGFDAIAIPQGKVSASRYFMKGGVPDNIEIVAIPRDKIVYSTTSPSESRIEGNEYIFKTLFKKGNEVLEDRRFIQEGIFNLKETLPKSYENFNSDILDILNNKYTKKELENKVFSYNINENKFIGTGKGKFELYDQAIPAYMKKYAKKWNAPVVNKELELDQPIKIGNDTYEKINYVVLKLTPEMKRSVQEKSQPLFNIVLPALSAGAGAKVISDNMENNTISNPTKN